MTYTSEQSQIFTAANPSHGLIRGLSQAESENEPKIYHSMAAFKTVGFTVTHNTSLLERYLIIGQLTGVGIKGIVTLIPAGYVGELQTQDDVLLDTAFLPLYSEIYAIGGAETFTLTGLYVHLKVKT